MKLNTKPETTYLFFEIALGYKGGLMTPTEMFSHEFQDGSYDYYIVYKPPVCTRAGCGSNYCKLSPSNVKAIQVKK